MCGLANKARIGFSVDYHNLVKDKNYEQHLGGLSFKLDYKIIAHSDGDIIIHTLSEAILGALGLGDLGDWFSDTDSHNKGRNSMEMLDFCISKCNEANYIIANADITLVSDVIFLKENKQKISEFLSKYLNTQVNLKATRFEDNCETKIKCYCSCLLINKNDIH